MTRQDNKHCIRCGEPTSSRWCVDCEAEERWLFEQELLCEGGC